MPRRVTWNPKSLFKKCLEVIACRVKDYDPNAQVTSSSNLVEEKESVSKSEVNPFDEWPIYLLEQIIHVLSLKSQLNINHRNLLVTRQTRELGLSNISGIHDPNTPALFLELAAIRCQQLTSLHMNGMKFIAEDFCNFLPHFKDLQELEVTYSAFNNCCLHTVGEYCRNLLKLNLDGCEDVTDDGIEALCGGESEPGKEVPLGKSGHCKSIQELSTDGTQVTQKGVQMALRHLPHLKKYDDRHLVQALASIHRHQTITLIYLMNSILPSEYSLTDLIVYCDYSFSSPPFVPYKKGDLRWAVSLCPFLSNVYIDCVVGINDYDILGLIELRHLNRLTIVASSPAKGRSITFDGGLVPILKAAGSSLKYLELKDFRFFDQSVRLDCLVAYCPNLEHLSLSCCKYSLSTGVEEGEVSDEVMAGRANKRMKPDFPWNHLKKLSLGVYVVSEKIPTESLFLALSSSPALEKLVIMHCSTLDDDLVHRVFECHSFASLKRLQLDFCNAITMRGVKCFLNIGMDWDHLSIFRCNSVKIEDDDELED